MWNDCSEDLYLDCWNYDCDVDFKVEHDSCCLCDGVDSSQQTLFKRSEDGCGGGGCWCWCVHSD